MASPYIGEIRIFAGNFAPRGWMFCQGQTLSISQYDTLFSLIGTTYGGDGQTTFNLPDLRSRIAVHTGTGSTGSSYVLGQAGGAENVALTTAQLPTHTHPAQCNNGAGDASTPAGNFWAGNANSGILQFAATNDSTMSASQISQTGSTQPHNNVMPYLAINYIIALEGIYPARS